MSMIEEMSPAPKKVMTLFYIIDTSESMSGAKIGTINSAMEECQGLLKEVANGDDSAEIKVAVMQFSSGCSWVTSADAPEDLSSWKWTKLHAEGITDLGSAFLELDNKLSRHKFLNSITGAYAPIILLFSDGGPTDNWEKGLNRLKNNKWFQYAIKIAVDIDCGSDRTVLSAFTGSEEAILDAKDKTTLKNMIHKVSVRASEFQSHSKASVDLVELTAEEDSANIAKAVVEEIQDENAEMIQEEDWTNW